MQGEIQLALQAIASDPTTNAMHRQLQFACKHVGLNVTMHDLWQVEQDDEDNWEYERTEAEDSATQQKDRCFLAKFFVADGIGRIAIPVTQES